MVATPEPFKALAKKIPSHPPLKRYQFRSSGCRAERYSKRSVSEEKREKTPLGVLSLKNDFLKCEKSRKIFPPSDLSGKGLGQIAAPPCCFCFLFTFFL